MPAEMQTTSDLSTCELLSLKKVTCFALLVEKKNLISDDLTIEAISSEGFSLSPKYSSDHGCDVLNQSHW